MDQAFIYRIGWEAVHMSVMAKMHPVMKVLAGAQAPAGLHSVLMSICPKFNRALDKPWILSTVEDTQLLWGGIYVAK